VCFQRLFEGCCADRRVSQIIWQSVERGVLHFKLGYGDFSRVLLLFTRARLRERRRGRHARKLLAARRQSLSLACQSSASIADRNANRDQTLFGSRVCSRHSGHSDSSFVFLHLDDLVLSGENGKMMWGIDGWRVLLISPSRGIYPLSFMKQIPLPLPLPLPSLLFFFLFSKSIARRSGERCELPQLVLGQIPSQKRMNLVRFK